MNLIHVFWAFTVIVFYSHLVVSGGLLSKKIETPQHFFPASMTRVKCYEGVLSRSPPLNFLEHSAAILSPFFSCSCVGPQKDRFSGPCVHESLVAGRHPLFPGGLFGPFSGSPKTPISAPRRGPVFAKYYYTLWLPFFE